ncbi:V0/A0 complex, 116-kDa subunit of ATPase [Yamadazyma tenuis ATCC 10573]|uniref:V-type proton ATPase subunit a n=1 Tax=Candida tenuis (strain ATCC 10573 / BCRC 21748 / CBS 615 / JCM 9827 / NBRC 10315 / NRRL Y-1498 / VKM Y-70) TaxID=590646 RepID=G3BAK8_CANTC|nr:V0/A0 complex, 116-kDa subunit of ATPase [Yamadazyma tenuis ATCC 10573]EGV61430.1 V0/A0 complex, 116-kDa subunit of ATPase [Yamadazyma tenuis ATCC 10573]
MSSSDRTQTIEDGKEEAIFRSATMSLVQLYLPTEISRELIYDIGKLNLVQFRDLNSKVSDFQRAFVNELRKLDNVERQFIFFKEELDKKSISLSKYPYESELSQVAPQSDIDELVDNGQILEDRVTELVDSLFSLYSKKKDLKQNFLTTQSVDEFFKLNTGNLPIEVAETADHNTSFITGTISRDKVQVLQQILWRVLRGNLYYYTEEFTEPIYDPKLEDNICESLDCDLYDVDTTAVGRATQLAHVSSNLDDLSTVLEQSELALNSELIAISKDLSKWWEIIAREKALYKTMNRCDYDGSRKTLIAEGWIPTDEIETLDATIKAGSQNLPTIVNILETTKTPPTFHRNNKFTAAFQNICDAYGVASYREVNPGLPTIITFPFMFAIMFGDLGHGIILSLAASTLVFNEKKIGAMKRDEIFDMAFSGRYILLFMGLFSIYTGFLYNDLFSKSMTLFKSGWVWPEDFEIGDTLKASASGIYPIGLDPAWHGTENALLFTNSYKMKLSILMGYIHMSYSYVFSLVNYIHFNSMIDVVGNFIPGLLFMQGIFGYLSLCIVYKWSVDWFAIEQQPPGLLNTLISMFLSPGTVAEPLYAGQSTVQVFLLLLALICVPWLLLVKPLYFKRKFDQEAKYHALQDEEVSTGDVGEHSEETADHGDDDDDEEAHEFGDIMIHQVIHTIEFCLNCVSHTASYLRLWALSLAHAQLSTVLWTMTIGNAFGATGVSGVIMTVLLFGMWFILTVVILVIMEGTSAMLHSLRLHWVESMSKFFVGGGHPYEPFGFVGLLDEYI